MGGRTLTVGGFIASVLLGGSALADGGAASPRLDRFGLLTPDLGFLAEQTTSPGAPTAPAQPESVVAPPPTPPPPVEAAAPAKPESHLFPLWGDKVRAKGFELPPAFGLMLNYYYQNSGIVLSNLQLGINQNPLRDASFISFG